MAISNSAFLSTTVIAFAAAPAIAQVTPDEVWDTWMEAVEASGYSMQVGNRSGTGNQLTLSDVVFDLTNESASLNGAISEIQLTSRGDGTVEVSYSPQYTMMVRGTIPDGGPVEIPISIDMSDLSTVVSGTTSEMRHELSATTITLSIDSKLSEDVPTDMSVSASLSELDGVMTLLDGGSIEQNMTAGNMTFMASLSDTSSDEGSADVSGALNNLVISSSGPIVSMMGVSGFADLLNSGIDAQTTVSFSDGGYSMRMQDEGKEFASDAALKAGSYAASISDRGIDYTTNIAGTEMTFESSQMPGGAAGFTAGAYSSVFSMPFDEAQSAEEIGMKMDLQDVEFSDGLWAMMDPFGAFPRGAASLRFDFLMTGDLLTTAIDQGMAGDTIPDFTGKSGALSIRDFELAFGDLSLGINGDLSATVPDDGSEPEMPTGLLSLKLVGLDGFLTQIESSGIFPPAQIATIRGMVGFMGRPGPDPDSMVSEIELTPNGITANGIPLPFAP